MVILTVDLMDTLTQKQVMRTFPPQTTAVHDAGSMTDIICLLPPSEADSLTKLLAVHGFMRKQTNNTPFKKCKLDTKHVNCEYEKY